MSKSGDTQFDRLGKALGTLILVAVALAFVVVLISATVWFVLWLFS